METAVERELKLEPPDGFELPPLDGENLESRVFTSTYYDTPPRSLLQAGSRCAAGSRTASRAGS